MMGVRVGGICQKNPADKESARCKCGSGERDDSESPVEGPRGHGC